MSKIIINNDYVEIISNDFKLKNNIAFFDLDFTLIRPKNGKKFPSDQETDWEFMYQNIKQILDNYIKNDYCILIISNQKKLGDKDLNGWVKKIESIIKLLKIPIKVYASIEDNIYRKPNLGFFNFVKSKINLDKSFFCGDALGRDGDYSDTDLKFALNAGLKIFSPENIFLNDNTPVCNIIDYAKYFDFNIKNKLPNKIKYDHDKDVIIMVGYPGSGKSTFVNKYLLKEDYHVLSLDSLKTKSKLLKEYENLLKLNKKIVIDNTSPTKESRKILIDLARIYNYNIRCLHMKTTENHALHNNMYRYLYKNSNKVPIVVYRTYSKNFEKPTISEGFYEVSEINPSIPNKKLEPEYFNYLY